MSTPPKHVQRRTPAPGHKKRPKRVNGVGTGDYVRFVHQGRVIHGYGTLYLDRVSIGTKPKRTTKIGLATVVEQPHGYHVSYP